MKGEPVYEDGKLVGHNLHYPAVMMTVRDARGYDQFVPAVAARVIFEPLKRQRSMFDED